MSKTDLKDDEARKAIVNDLDTCILVEAGAGSGKTYSLVQRMVALVAGGKCPVDKLAAVTFTRKAASELKGRFQLALERAFEAEKDQAEKENLGRALMDLDRCFIGTIHSFCSSLLRERPVEAGLDPDFTELDEMEEALLINRVWEEYLVQVQITEPEKLDDLLEIDVDPQGLKDSYIELSSYPEVEIVCEDAIYPSLGEVREALKKLLGLAEEKLPQSVPHKGWDSLQKLLRTALRRSKVFSLEDDLVLLRLLADLDKKGDITKNRWMDKADAEFMKSAFDNFRGGHVIPALKAWREYRHAKVLSFVLTAVDFYRDQRLRQSKLNFQDLLVSTAVLLKDRPEVRRYFQERYKRILVDEFQDTDPVQAEIMFYLTGEDVNEKDWRRITPRPGTLFVVGDPKQAIYRFRRADIDIYNEVKKLIVKGGGRVLHLTANFRSVTDIADLVNPVFKDLLPEEDTPFQAAFSSLDAVRVNQSGTIAGTRMIAVPRVYRHNQQEIVEIDTSRIARWIRWAIDGGISLARTGEEKAAGLTERPRPGDFMVLLRYKANMDTYARALEDQGIPFHIASGGGLSGSTELAELLKVLKALADPDDPVRLAAVLRGALFGLNDNQLWCYKKSGGRFNYLFEVPGSLAAEDREVFEWVFGTLKKFRDWTLSLPASTALENIVKELGIIPFALTGELGKSRSGHIVHCLEFIAAAERKGITSFSSLVEYLTLLLEAGVEEEINMAPWENDTVRIMNLHKAKGLEAPVVFLANPGKSVSRPPEKHINRAGGTPKGYFVIKKVSGYSSDIIGQPLQWEEYAETESKYLEAEEIRLLYVAATRAKNLLVVSTYPEKAEASPWKALHGHLAGVPELEGYEGVSGKPDGNPESRLSGQDLEKARTQFLGPGSTINNPSYSLKSVTSIAKGAGEGPERNETGYGLSWGRVVHRVLEACAVRMPANIELFVDNIMAEEGRSAGEKDEVIVLVNQVVRSGLWERMLKSKRRFVEVPFSVMEADPENRGDRIVSGVIDLVFLEDDGWVIADYKTDNVDNQEYLDDLVRYYTPQVEMYKDYWVQLSREKVSEAGLYFTSLNKWVTL